MAFEDMFDENDDPEMVRQMLEIRADQGAIHDKVKALLTPELSAQIFHLRDSKALHERAREVFPDTQKDLLYDIIFHLTDWREDAACLLALTAHPDNFSLGEVRKIISNFLVHAPNHVVAAARLSGNPVRDIFKVGPLEEQPGEDPTFTMR